MTHTAAWRPPQTCPGPQLPGRPDSGITVGQAAGPIPCVPKAKDRRREGPWSPEETRSGEKTQAVCLP